MLSALALALLVAQAGAPAGKPTRKQVAAQLKVLVLEPAAPGLAPADRARASPAALAEAVRGAAADAILGLGLLPPAQAAAAVARAGALPGGCAEECAARAGAAAGADFVLWGSLAKGAAGLSLRLVVHEVAARDDVKATTLKGASQKELEDEIPRRLGDLLAPVSAALERRFAGAAAPAPAPAAQAPAARTAPAPAAALVPSGEVITACTDRGQSGRDGVPADKQGKPLIPTEDLPRVESCADLAGKLKLAVLNLDVVGGDLSAGEAGRVDTKGLAQELANLVNGFVPGVKVAKTAEVLQVLEAMNMDPAKCGDLCAVDRARAAQVDYLVEGRLRRVPEGFRVDLELWTALGSGGRLSGLSLVGGSTEELARQQRAGAPGFLTPINRKVRSDYKEQSDKREARIDARVQELRRAEAAAQAAREAQAKAEADAAERTLQEEREAMPRRAVRRKVGWGVLIGGLAAGGVSVFGMVYGLSLTNKIKTGSYSEVADLKEASSAAGTVNLLTIVLGSAGAAAALTGITLIAVNQDPEPKAGRGRLGEAAPPPAPPRLEVLAGPGMLLARGSF